MPLPDFQTLMFPFLKVVHDGREYKISEVREMLAKKLEITPQQRRELLPSGSQPIFDNRVAWTKTHLAKAGLLESPRRGIISISEKGTDVLKQNPPKINIAFLKQYPTYIDFITPNQQKEENSEPITTEESINTPSEIIESAIIQMNKQLSQDLRDSLNNMDPYKFEVLVIDLLQAMGYGGNREEAAQVTKKSGDGGIDGIINEDRLGLDKIYVQAKKWEGNVTISSIRDFGGTLLAHSAQKGIFITTSDFPKSAIDYCEKIDRTIILINGKRLTELMIEYNVGVSMRKTFVMKEVDSDYFED